MLSTRIKRIEELQNIILGFKELARPFLESISRAEVELNRLKRGFETGEHVQVTTTCRRGCCVEQEFEGVVEGITPNGSYHVRCPDGVLMTYVSDGDMKRIC